MTLNRRLPTGVPLTMTSEGLRMPLTRRMIRPTSKTSMVEAEHQWDHTGTLGGLIEILTGVLNRLNHLAITTLVTIRLSTRRSHHRANLEAITCTEEEEEVTLPINLPHPPTHPIGSQRARTRARPEAALAVPSGPCPGLPA